jgi:uncharacterized membrane protein YphA (DoxX/SURF4 family)
MRIELDDTPQASLVSLTQAGLRCALGGIILFHGIGKLQHPAAYAEQLTNAGLPDALLLTQVLFSLELLIGGCLIVGRFTRTAAFFAVCDIALQVALNSALGNPWQTPAILEPTLLMLAVCGFLLVVGSGPYGLDPFFKRRARLRAIAKDEIWSRPPYVSEH